MLKYLIIGSLVLIILASLFLLLNKGDKKGVTLPLPVIQNQPSGSNQNNLTSSPPSLPAETAEEKLVLQTKADVDFAQWQEKTYQDYPWYNKLPLKEADFYVYFDLNKKRFVADLYPRTNSSSSIDQQNESMKSQILNKLQEYSINTSQFDFEWNSHPE
jgi:hypothetical protein